MRRGRSSRTVDSRSPVFGCSVELFLDGFAIGLVRKRPVPEGAGLLLVAEGSLHVACQVVRLGGDRVTFKGTLEDRFGLPEVIAPVVDAAQGSQDSAAGRVSVDCLFGPGAGALDGRVGRGRGRTEMSLRRKAQEGHVPGKQEEALLGPVHRLGGLIGPEQGRNDSLPSLGRPGVFLQGACEEGNGLGRSVGFEMQAAKEVEGRHVVRGPLKEALKNPSGFLEV